MPDPERPTRGFPLFPLGIVALPSEGVPLHIFEDRYRKMIEHCLLAPAGSPGRQFGILWLSDQELKAVGCVCEVEEVLERMDDGRLNILARGVRPFRLLERQDDLPYPAGVVEPLEETDEQSDPEAGRAARELYGRLVSEATDRELEAEELDLMDAYRMAATVEFDIADRQELLELRSENARLRLLARLLARRSSTWRCWSAPRCARCRTARSGSASRTSPEGWAPLGWRYRLTTAELRSHGGPQLPVLPLPDQGRQQGQGLRLLPCDPS
jgi:Lon protease-like protein